MSDERTLIRADGLSLSRGGRSILEGVSLTVARGEIVTLVGPNGAGKTTLLRVLLGVTRPDSGDVRRAPGLVPGYLPQRLDIDPIMPLPVRRLMTLTRRASREEVAAALAEVGAAHLVEAEASSLSGGELRRVLLARALLRRPDVLFLDEPTQGVDFAGEIALYRLIERLRDRLDCAVVMVSHDLHVVMAATDRVVCLNRRVCCVGHPETVREDPGYAELFGPAAQDIAVYHHDHAHRHGLEGESCPLPPGHVASREPAERGRGAGR